MADLTITVDDQHLPRVKAGIGAHMKLLDENGDPRDATADEMRAFLVDYVIKVVRLAERDAQRRAIAITDIGAS
jgi:hypothetical protein